MVKKEELKKLNEYWNALNYLAVGQLYLLDNPLLKRKLELKDVKHKIIGHWGTVPGQTMIYTHLNRIINKYDLNMIYLSGPGHGGNAPVSGTYLEGSYSEIYPEVSLNEEGMQKLFKRFSFPGGISSHAAPETPGSIHEGGELGYSLAHAFGAVLDNKDLIACAVVGDGEAETGPLATSWHYNKFLNPEKDGVVLPILHLNGFKINNPAVLARIDKDDLYDYFIGLGYKPYYVHGSKPMSLHKQLASAMDKCIEDIKFIKENSSKIKRIMWPMIVFETPKGMTGPKEIVGSYKAHQVPFQVENEEDLQKLDVWLKSYKPEKLFDEKGRLRLDLKDINPTPKKKMGLNPVTNGGLLLKDLILPDVKTCGVEVKNHGLEKNSDMMMLGKYLKEVFILNDKNQNFRIFGPDEAMSNRFNHVFETENKTFNLPINKNEELLSKDGRMFDVMLSEHLCHGALEAYLLTGRHGIMHSYEAFIRVVDSMATQHAKWLKVSNELPWRKDIASLNYLLTSHCWQQDHNGYTHQDPGFLNHIATKKPEATNIFLPIDANTLICSVDKMLKSKNKINVCVASKHPSLQWLSMTEASKHLKNGISKFEWASTDTEKTCDIVLACAGDTPTLEVLAASNILKEHMPTLKVRVINVLELFKLAPSDRNPNGLSDKEYNELFTKNKPILFAFHGYAGLIHELTYDRENKNLTVRGYNEEGTITTPFDMRVQNKIDRYNLILDVLKLTKKKNDALEKLCLDTLKKHHGYIRQNGKDIDEVVNFTFDKN